jgi:hypothetical protein
MVHLIVVNKVKGKTHHLLEKVNSKVQETTGNIVYLDKSAKHMYELNNKVRLINVSDYYITNSDEFVGFICGIISQDHDLQNVFLDSFLPVSHLEGKDIAPVVEKLEKLGEAFHIDFVLSVGVNEDELPEALKAKVIVSL